jgi:hypothetical protein
LRGVLKNRTPILESISFFEHPTKTPMISSIFSQNTLGKYTGCQGKKTQKINTWDIWHIFPLILTTKRKPIKLVTNPYVQ